jgi:hypothetical protein
MQSKLYPSPMWVALTLLTTILIDLRTQQMPLASGEMREFIRWIVEVGFAIVVASYLLVVNTRAINALRDEVRKQTHALTVQLSRINRDARGMQSDVKEIADAIRDEKRERRPE